MKATDTITRAVEELKSIAHVDAGVINKRHSRYQGKTSIPYTMDEVNEQYAPFNVNLCKTAVDAVAERIRLKGVDLEDEQLTARARRLFQRANFDAVLPALVTEMLALGKSYALVWPDNRGVISVTAESPLAMTVDTHPVSGEVTRALKTWSVDRGRGLEEYAALYLPEVITIVKGTNANLEVVEQLPNPLGIVPIVPLVNAARPGDTGISVIDDMGHIVDALSKVLIDMLVTSEDVARPRRWATGVTLQSGGGDATDWTADSDAPGARISYGSFDDDEDEAVSPFDESNRMWTAESESAKFGQLDGASLAGYRTAVDLLVQQIMAVSDLPAHMVGITTANPGSADGIRASEAGLTARAEARIRIVARAVEHIAQIMLAMDTGRLPGDYAPTATFASPGTRSTAQEADAVTKLHALGIISTDEARAMMGINTL